MDHRIIQLRRIFKLKLLYYTFYPGKHLTHMI